MARQELLAQELEQAGQVHMNFSRDVHCRTLSDPAVLKQRLGGIDWGGVSPTALVVGGLDGGGRAWAISEYYRHQSTLDETAQGMADLQQRYGVKRWIADPAGKAEIQKLRNMGFNVSPARHGNRLKLRVQLMGARLNLGPGKLPGIYFTPECPNLIAEVEGLMWRRTRLTGGGEEMLTDEFERGTPDHAWDAMVNILAEWDAVPEPWQPPKEALRVW